MVSPEPQQPEFLSTARPSPAQRMTAAVIMAVSLAAFFCAAPFARIRLPRIPSVIAAYESALFLCDLLTAVLVLWQLMQVRSKALVVLMAAYFYDAAIIIPHALTFPGMFAPAGLLGGHSQTTAWLYMAWHSGFPLFIIGFAWLDSRNDEQVLERVDAPVLLTVAGVLLLVGAITAATLISGPVLPTLVRGDDYTRAIRTGVSPAVWLLSLIAFVSLRPWRPRSVLNLWLGVVMFAWMLEVAASAVIGTSRFDVGFYAGRLYGLIAATFVLITLLIELGRLHQRLTAAQHVSDRARVLRQVVDALEHERQRIARELHDEMGSYLTGMKVGLDLLARDASPQAVEPLQKLLAQTDIAVDRLTLELRPPTLQDMGVNRAIAELAERFTAATGIRVDVHGATGGERLADSVETTLYRAVQEALTNVWKHSGARTVSVILDRRPDSVQLIIEDDGHGFDAAGVMTNTERKSGFGLQGMTERVRMLNGTVAIESAEGGGTSLYIRVPVGSFEAVS